MTISGGEDVFVASALLRRRTAFPGAPISPSVPTCRLPPKTAFSDRLRLSRVHPRVLLVVCSDSDSDDVIKSSLQRLTLVPWTGLRSEARVCRKAQPLGNKLNADVCTLHTLTESVHPGKEIQRMCRPSFLLCSLMVGLQNRFESAAEYASEYVPSETGFVKLN